MNRRALFLAVVVAAGMSWTSNVHAQVGTQLFNDAAPIQTGDIGSATSFMIGDLQSDQAVAKGIFMGMAMVDFGQVSFSAANPTSFNVSDVSSGDIFGTFNSSSITEITQTSSLVVFDIQGLWTPSSQDSLFSGYPGPYQSTFDVTFTADSSGTISDTAFFSVPEPTSVVMGLTSLIAGGLVYLVRRGAASVAAA